MKPLHLFMAALAACSVPLAGCGPVRLVAHSNIPQPLVVKIPIDVALFVPKEFAQYAHEEERWSTKWHVELGAAQTEGLTRLFSAMFNRVVPVESVNAGAQAAGIAAILEPSIEEYAFVTPRDAGSSFYAVSIKYRVNVYTPDGKLADSWGFTGYGSAPAEGLSSAPPLAAATALAMRDAGAKLAVEFREQAIVRGLLPGQAVANEQREAAHESSTPESSTPESSTQESSTRESSTQEPAAQQTPASENPTSESAPTAGEPQSPPQPAEAPAETPTEVVTPGEGESAGDDDSGSDPPQD